MEKFLRRRQVVELTGLSDSFFKKAAMKGSGPSFAKIGRVVVYAEREVLDWLEEHKRAGAGANPKKGANNDKR